uniref:Uncharacterized protein n=1 Tax=Brassica oleracea var. oleracea TaxID=109376 RepID=A0A0D3DXW7_BRAOL
MKHNIKNNNIKSIASKVQLTACSTHRLGEEAGMGSEDYKEAKAAVPGDHSTSLAAMIDNAAAGSGEGMVVVAPGYEVVVVARPAYSKVLVGEDEMGSEFLVEAANLKPSADAQMGMDQRLNVTGFDTSLARDVLEEMALKLSGRSAGGFNLVVNAVLPLRQNGGGGVSRARMLAMAKKDEAGRLAEAARLAKIKRTKAARLAKAETAKAARLAMAEKDKAILSEGNQKSIMTTD